MKRISILTATRAEYGLLKPIISALKLNSDFDIRIVVTGAHLSTEFGFTYKEIENDGFFIDEKIETLLSSDLPSSISKSMGLAMIGFAEYFDRINPDLLIVLGDRYETLSVAMVAMNQRIPIVHLYGGEKTEGAIDESIRHAITKLSYLHFTSTEEYRQRVIQLGEHPSRVFNVGASGIENIKTLELMSKEDLEKSIGILLDKPFAVVTFHPVTLEDNHSQEQMKELLNVCKQHKEMIFIFTKGNADANGRIINRMIDEFALENEHAIAFSSLGTLRYLSALKHCFVVIGNSSSGLIESPSFHIPAINIGNRQKGRIQASNVINCDPLSEDIEKALVKVSDKVFREGLISIVNPYGDGNSSVKVVSVIKAFMSNQKIDLEKSFYDYKEC